MSGDSNVARMAVNQMSAGRVYNWLKNNLGALLPASCRLCGAEGQHGRELCSGCEHDLPWNTTPCRRCGMALAKAAGDKTVCGRCLRRPPAFHSVVAPFIYTAPLDRLIHAFKFRGDLAAGRLLSELLQPAVATRQVDLVLPVPLHPVRIRRRGFNQALELARHLRRHLGIPLAPDLLVRSRDTPSQHELPAKARRANIRGAFQIRHPLPATRVAVIDDVLTTGHTAGEIARTLRRAGAEHVEIWVVARA